MALSPDDKFIYVNPDTTSGEYNLAQFLPVKYLRGLECANAAHCYLYFRGPKDAFSTRVQVSITSGKVKEFFTQFTDEVNFGEASVITLADRNIAVDATTGGTDFTHVNAFVAPSILSDVTQAGYEDVQVAEDLDVGGSLTLDSVALSTVQTSSESFVDDDTSIMTSAAIDDRINTAVAGAGSGDITAVTITTDTGGGSAASQTSGSADFSIIGTQGVNVTNAGADATVITVSGVAGEIDHDSLLNFASNEHYTQANIVATGALDSGSITSGFGNVDIGSSTLDTTGAVSTGIITPTAIKHTISGNNAGDYGSGAEILFGISDDSTTAGEIYVLRNGVWTLIDADILSTVSQLAAVAVGTHSGNDGMLIKGCVTLNSAYTAGSDSEGAVVYASATAGEATLTAPSSSAQFVRILGYSLNVSDKKMFFNPDSTFVKIA
mgnify:CR=1 FL=1